MSIKFTILIAAGFVTTPALAQSLTGDVALESGTPVANYPVIIEDPSGSTSVVITDPSGKFEIPVKEYGEYTAQPSSDPTNQSSISVEKPGFIDWLKTPSRQINNINNIGKIVISPF